MDPQPTVPPAPVTTTVAPTHSKWPLILGGLALLIVGGIGGVFLGKQLAYSTPVQNSAVTTTADQTANWKTYNNVEDKFSVGYPYDWQIQSSNKDLPHWTTLSSPDIQEETTGVVSGQKVTIYVAPEGLFDPNSTASGDSDRPKLVSEEKTLINDIQATQRIFVNSLGETGEVFITEIPREEKVYTMICHSSKQLGSSVRTLCNQILSTFKFTNSQSNWKTYSDENLSLMYPGYWTQKPAQLTGSGKNIEFTSGDGSETFTISTHGNYNQITGQAFASVDEYLKYPDTVTYPFPTIQASNTSGSQFFPRAGSEQNSAATFLSLNNGSFVTIELDLDHSASPLEVSDGQKTFAQIVASLKLLK